MRTSITSISWDSFARGNVVRETVPKDQRGECAWCGRVHHLTADAAQVNGELASFELEDIRRALAELIGDNVLDEDGDPPQPTDEDVRVFVRRMAEILGSPIQSKEVHTGIDNLR